MSLKLDSINGDYKEKVVKSVYYYKDIFEYGEATFGEKAALSFFDELSVTYSLESQYLYFIQNAAIWKPNLKNTEI